MTEPITDRDLLRQYAEQGSESAFKTLVGRHVDLVYGTALRGLSDAPAAQEVTQNVFIMLARKSLWLDREVNVAAWLHRAALLEARRWWRGELRRRRREQSAAELGTLMKNEDSLLQALQSELDEGLLSLRETDRAALIMRYIEGRSHREIGALVGAREDAVRMRVSKALERLTQFFRRRGHAVPAVAITAAALGASAKAAPAGLAAAAAGAGLAAGGSGAATGFKLVLTKLMGLTKLQTSVLCVVLAAAPAAWEWHGDRRSQAASDATRVRLDAALGDQARAADDLRRLQAESARLDLAISNAVQNQARYDAAAVKLEALKSRVRGLLTDARYHWPDDLPYVRVSKAEVRSLDMLHKPGNFGPDGVLNHTAQEMLGITDAEKGPVEEVLAAYWNGVNEMTENNVRRSSVTTNASGEVTFTAITPPLGDPVKTLAANTATQISNLLGRDREQLVFGDWGEGGIQIFAPGNLWHLGDQAQEFTVWVNPQTRKGGSGHHVDGSGIGSGIGFTDYGTVPSDIFKNTFLPWMAEVGVVVPPSDRPGN
jgi:RNA polymerase sigma factor (sigma-70 family)